jgi:uncharacterized 2Fe-2S/4Fe-4S cluster protein (DUF4445 family)
MSDTSEEYQVIFLPSGRRGRVPTGETLLDAARQVGVDIESICGGRLTCAKCVIRVEEGDFTKHGIVSSASHVAAAGDKERTLLARTLSDRQEGYRLACSATVEGDVLIYVPEESRAQKQVIHKAAREMIVDVKPAVRQVYVEVEKAQLGEHRGDWGRLQAALQDQWALSGLRIDLIALRRLQPALQRGNWGVTVTLWQDTEVIDVQAGYQEGVYGLAVDIGSTTVAGHLCDLRTGRLLVTEALMNAQVAYGEDLMSRISYAMTHPAGLDKLHKAIIEVLNTLSSRAARRAGLSTRAIHELVIAGNTTMIHLLLGIDPRELGAAPFALSIREATDVKARDLELHIHPGGNVHILPAEAGHVGADNVAVLLAEQPHHRSEITLIADVGTNAEIVLGNRERLYSASSPTGPAFEGAQISFGMRAAPGAIERVRVDSATWEARFRVIGEERWSDEWPGAPDTPPESQPRHLATGICGSGIIEAVAELFLAGIITGDGRFTANRPHPRLIWQGKKGAFILAKGEQTANGRPILVTQDDIRSVQLAKAALYTGVKLLMKRAAITHIDRVVLAGAFGSYIDPKYAMLLGLIPDCPLERVMAVGNAAGDGARIALLNRHAREEATHVAQWVRYIETAADPDFQDEFVSALHLPHATDSFPNLANLFDLPASRRVARERRVARPLPKM